MNKTDFEKAVDAENLHVWQQAITKFGTRLTWTEPRGRTMVQACGVHLAEATPLDLGCYEAYQRAQGNRQLARQVATVRRAMVKARARTYADL